MEKEKNRSHLNSDVGMCVKRILQTIALPVMIYILFIICAPNRFGTAAGLYILLQQSIIPTVIGYAMSFGFIANIQDFSIGARLLFGGLIGGVLGVSYGMVWMILGCITAGILSGIIAGLVFRFARIPSMILSFGLVMIFEVLGAYIAGSQGMIRLNQELSLFGRAPYNFIVLIIAFVLFYFLYYRTRFSYNVRAVGSDPQISKNMGIKVTNVKVGTYIIGALLLGIASLLQLGYAGTMGSQVGMSTLAIVFRPMMAVMIGLVLESVVILPVGIFIGALSINMIFAGIIALEWPDSLQNVSLGFFMILVMGVSANRVRIMKAAHGVSAKRGKENTAEC